MLNNIRIDIATFRRNAPEKFWMWLAWNLPKPLVKWAAVRLMAHATTGKYSNQEPTRLNAIEALERWE